MYQVSMITQQEMRPLPLYTGAALVYFAVILVASYTLRAASERWRNKIFA
jgi:polar amino acid transport system permease protein